MCQERTRAGELRAGLVPAGIKKLTGLGFEVAVETGIGAGARIPDDDYREAGASIAPDAASVVAGADIVVRVRKPAPEEVPNLQAAPFT